MMVQDSSPVVRVSSSVVLVPCSLGLVRQYMIQNSIPVVQVSSLVVLVLFSLGLVRQDNSGEYSSSPG